MFLLKTLPNSAQIAKFASRYPELQPETLEASLRLVKAASLITSSVEKELSRHRLTQAKFIVLMVLGRSPQNKLRPAEIASATGVSKKNTARLLEAMTESGLVVTRDHESDQRSYQIETTANGKALLERVLPKYYRVLNASMRPLRMDQKKSLSKAMDLIIEALE